MTTTARQNLKALQVRFPHYEWRMHGLSTFRAEVGEIKIYVHQTFDCWVATIDFFGDVTITGHGDSPVSAFDSALEKYERVVEANTPFTGEFVHPP